VRSRTGGRRPSTGTGFPLAPAASTLADRLRRLTAAGILVRAAHDAGRERTRTEYRMSERGWDPCHVLTARRETRKAIEPRHLTDVSGAATT
jgi:DNA-binding HxlR family transcriptional regulator